MLKPISALLSAALLAGALGAPAALAAPKSKPAAVKQAAPKKAAKPVKPAKRMATEAKAMSAASGTMKVFMDLSSAVKGYTRDHASRAAAAATVYTNREGALTGLTIQSWGLPDPERMDSRTSRYVVWLVDDHGQRVRKLGMLESRNGSKAVFGFTPERPMAGWGRLMITAESMEGVSHPSGMMHMSADLGAKKMAAGK